MHPAAALLAALLLLAPAPAPPGDGSAAEAAAKALTGLMKKRTLGKRDPEEMAKRIGGLEEGDLSWVLDRLREVPEGERGAAAPEVEKALEDALLTVRYGAGVLGLGDAWKRFEDPSEGARCALLADLARLEDAEPGTRLGLWALEGGSLPVRIRALETLADLCSFGGEEARILPALRKALDDPSPALRDLALERLANLSDTAALDWAIAHAGEEAAETAEVRGVREERCPGERALDLLGRTSRIRFGLSGEEFRALPAAERAALLEEYRKWRAGAGGNPLRNGEDGPFAPVPKVTTVLVDPLKAPLATLRWWSEVDRAQFRLDLEDLEVVAATRIDWVANFRLTVIASGARQGNWETYARKVRCGVRHRMPRKGFALLETSIQPLLDGRWKVWVRAYESR